MWELGEWTDDTAMALELAESLAERGGYDEDDVLARYMVWARSGAEGHRRHRQPRAGPRADAGRCPRGGGRLP